MDISEIIPYAGATVIAIVLFKYIINWWFQIDKRIRIGIMQNNLLIELCKKQGVDVERVNKIIDDYNGVKKKA